jgi:hypothetical protein
MRLLTPSWKMQPGSAPVLAPAARKIVNLKHYRIRRDKSL